MGRESISSATLLFGTQVYSASLYFTFLSFLEVSRALDTLRLLQLRKQAGTLKVENGNPAALVVGKIPEEVWGMIRRKAYSVARDIARAEERKHLAMAMCAACRNNSRAEGDEGADGGKGGWCQYPPFKVAPYGSDSTQRCVACVSGGEEVMKQIFAVAVNLLLARYGLACTWRHTSRESDDTLWPENDVSMRDRRHPLKIAIISPALPSKGPMRILGTVGTASTGRFDEEISETLGAGDIVALVEKHDQKYAAFFRVWDVELPDPELEGQPGLMHSPESIIHIMSALRHTIASSSRRLPSTVASVARPQASTTPQAFHPPQYTLREHFDKFVPIEAYPLIALCLTVSTFGLSWGIKAFNAVPGELRLTPARFKESGQSKPL
ncbi:hypothetical protein JCM11641_007516 [Rhodosporidiobolus odoratus]